MTAPRDLFTNSCAAAEGPGKVFDEPSPPFQLTRQFAPPRTAVVSVKKLQPHPAMIRRGLAGLNYTGGSQGPSAERRRGGSGTQMDQVLRLKTVMAVTGLSRSSIYNAIRKGEFPANIPLGARSVGWLRSDLESWLSQRIEQSGRRL